MTFQGHIQKAFKVTLFFLCVCLFGWALLETYRSYFAGLFLGVLVSMINAWYLSWKIQQAANAAVNNTGRRVNLGFLTRASMALLAVVVALRYKQEIDLVSTIIGFLFFQLVTLILGISSTWAKKS